MPKSKVCLSRQKSSRSRTNRAKNIKRSWTLKKEKENDAKRNIIENVERPESPVELTDLETVWNVSSAAKNNSPKVSDETIVDMDMAWGTAEEFDSIMAEEIPIEIVQQPEKVVVGNRIVNFSFVFEKIIYIAEKHARACTCGSLKINKEVQSGLESVITLHCAMCEKTFTCSTVDSTVDSLNKAAVWATVAVGSTYNHTQEMLSVMNIPPLSNTLFYTIQEQLSQVWMACSITDMEAAGKEEHAIAVEKGHVDSDGIPWISVYLDGGWSKRSYGHSYNAASGVGVIIGRQTKKVLYMGVRNKFCIICSKAENQKVVAKPHNCFKNWEGSSSAMEADIIVEGFCSSITMHNLRYKEFVADGDSSVYAKIIQKVPYGKEVTKIECTNHIIKNYGKRLYALKQDTKNISLAARKQLTGKRIGELQKIAQKAIYDNAHGDIGSLIEDLNNGPSHIFGHHVNCKDYYCSCVGETGQEVKDVKLSGLFRLVQGALNPVVRKANSLIDNETNNRAELFMAILSRFNAGKRLNLTQRGSFQCRSYLTALRYNKGVNWHNSPWKKTVQKSPGKYFKKFMTSQNKYNRKLKYGRDNGEAKRRITSNKKNVTSQKNTDYGPLAIQPEISQEELAEQCLHYLNTLTVTAEDVNNIAASTVGQFDNPIYRTHRAHRLTASNFGDVVRRRDQTSCHSLVKRILHPVNVNTPAIEYGKTKEAVAISLLEEKLGVKVAPSGLFIDIEHCFLGASPDGLVGEDEIVEVKCLLKVSQLGITLEEAVRQKMNICLEFKNNSLTLQKNHNYYFQVQGQLHIANKSSCYFVVFVNTKTELFVEKIKRDDLFWKEQMETKLVRFYKYCILPEIIRGNLQRGLRCEDPDYIKEAQKKATSKKIT